MVKIKTSSLKKFLDAAKAIGDNHLIPIYAFVKLECLNGKAKMYKSNGNSFVVCEIDGVEFKGDQTFLINEQTLSVAVSYSTVDTITLKVQDSSIVIDNGKKLKSVTEKVEHFPAIQKRSEDEKVELLTTDVLVALFYAKNHITPPTDRAMRAWMSYIHIVKIKEKFYVVGLNGHITYFKSFSHQLPILSLEPEVVSVITKFSSLHYSRVGNYDYFDNGSIAYGFIKSETTCPALGVVLEKFTQEESMVLGKKQLIDFCEMAIGLNRTSIPPEVKITDEKDGVMLNFSDMLGEQMAADKIIPKEKNFTVDEFIFQPKFMTTILNSIDGEDIRLSYLRSHHNMVVSSDDDKSYIGSIMALAPLQTN